MIQLESNKTILQIAHFFNTIDNPSASATCSIASDNYIRNKSDSDSLASC